MPDVDGRRPVEQDDADDALHSNLFGAFLKAIPTTAAGTVELGRCVLAYNQFQGGILDERDLIRVLTLIAAVPAA